MNTTQAAPRRPESDDELDAWLAWPLHDDLPDAGFSAAVLARLDAAPTQPPARAAAPRTSAARPRHLSPDQALARLGRQVRREAMLHRHFAQAALLGTLAALLLALPGWWVDLSASAAAAAAGPGGDPMEQLAWSASGAALLVSATLAWALGRS